MPMMDGVFEDNVRRVRSLLGELGLPGIREQQATGMWQSAFLVADVEMMTTVNQDCPFLELSVNFHFEPGFADFLMNRMDDFQQLCYQKGCYHLISLENVIITVSVCSKLYYSGFQYYALKETIDDLMGVAVAVRRLFDPETVLGGGKGNGHT